MFVEEFASAPKIGNLTRRPNHQGKDMMLFDLGLNKNDLDNNEMVFEKIQEVEDQFDLVMIAEQFSQSLVLLNNELCWEIQDVTSFHLNGRQKDIKSQLNGTTRKLLKEYLKSDYVLYNHFLKIFQLN